MRTSVFGYFSRDVTGNSLKLFHISLGSQKSLTRKLQEVLLKKKMKFSVKDCVSKCEQIDRNISTLYKLNNQMPIFSPSQKEVLPTYS